LNFSLSTLLSDNLLKSFKKEFKVSIGKCFQQLDTREFTVEDFKHYMIAGAVASSQIEVCTFELNSFYRAKTLS
jgi:hypothetical protein